MKTLILLVVVGFLGFQGAITIKNSSIDLRISHAASIERNLNSY